MLDELNSRTLPDRRCGCNFCGDICDSRFLGMRNFDGEYLQVMERAGRGCEISMRSILTLSKMWDADEKFAKEASSNPRKGKM